jgi:hypothetical protein
VLSKNSGILTHSTLHREAIVVLLAVTIMLLPPAVDAKWRKVRRFRRNFSVVDGAKNETIMPTERSDLHFKPTPSHTAFSRLSRKKSNSMAAFSGIEWDSDVTVPTAPSTKTEQGTGFIVDTPSGLGSFSNQAQSS